LQCVGITICVLQCVGKCVRHVCCSLMVRVRDVCVAMRWYVCGMRAVVGTCVCCSVSQCVAVCCSVLQCVAVCWYVCATRVWQCVSIATCVLQCACTCVLLTLLQCDDMLVLQCVAVWWSITMYVLQWQCAGMCVCDACVNALVCVCCSVVCFCCIVLLSEYMCCTRTHSHTHIHIYTYTYTYIFHMKIFSTLFLAW